MKKFICTLLAILSVLGLCACGQTEPTQAPAPTDAIQATEAPEVSTEAVAQEPTQEENALILDYYDTMHALENREPSAAEREKLYQKLAEMTGYDKFIGTEYATAEYVRSLDFYRNNEISTWDRQEVLSRFTILDDQLLSVSKVSEDKMGNQHTDDDCIQWNYNTNGQLLFVTDEGAQNPINLDTILFSSPQNSKGYHEYDENGRLETISYIDGYGSILMKRTFTYDENGNLTQQVATTNTKECTFTYTTENGRVTSINWTTGDDYRYEIVYTYEGDNLVSEVKRHFNKRDLLVDQWSMTHTYDSKGQRVESVYLWEGFFNMAFTNSAEGSYVADIKEDRYTYEYVDGRISVVTCTTGAHQNLLKDGTVSSEYADTYATITYTLNYGPYYIYTAPVAEN